MEIVKFVGDFIEVGWLKRSPHPLSHPPPPQCMVLAIILIHMTTFFIKGASVFFDPQKVESPSSKEEILQIVQYAIENDQHVRVLGSGHSRSDIALSDDIMISLHRYNGVVGLDKQFKQVSLQLTVYYISSETCDHTINQVGSRCMGFLNS